MSEAARGGEASRAGATDARRGAHARAIALRSAGGAALAGLAGGLAAGALGLGFGPRAAGLALAQAALGAALAAWFSRGVARRAGDRAGLLLEAARRASEGDLRVRVRPRGGDELEALAGAFNAMVEQLALERGRAEQLQRIAAWQEFARRLAHEIKNPLTPILLAVQEVASRYAGDDERFARTLRSAREVVEEEVATLRRMVSAFSEYARLPEPALVRGDLRELLRRCEEAHALRGDAARARVRFEAPDAPVPAAYDAQLLRRALENLLENAEHAGASSVWLRLEARDGQAWLEVEDDGPGVDEAARERVFEAYFTTKAERGGSGLGLSIVRKVALEHGGDAGCFARREGARGARFALTLPLARPREQRPTFVTVRGEKGPLKPPLTDE